MKNVLLLVIIFLISCTKENQNREIEYFIFGRGIGEECVGPNCQLFFRIENEKVYFLHDNKFLKHDLGIESYGVALHLLNSFPEHLYQEPNTFYGNEKMSYFGGKSIIMKRTGEDRVGWSFSWGNEDVPEHILSYAMLVDTTISKLIDLQEK